MSDRDRWLSVSEAAARLGISVDSVRRRADEGLIVARWTRPPRPGETRGSGQRQYLESSVEAFRLAIERTAAAGEASDA